MRRPELLELVRDEVVDGRPGEQLKDVAGQAPQLPTQEAPLAQTEHAVHEVEQGAYHVNPLAILWLPPEEFP